MFLQQCPHCAHVNPTGSRFCNACGGPLDLAPCPHCGAINAAGDATCRDCGARLAAPGEREPALRQGREPSAHPGSRIEHAIHRDAARHAPAGAQPDPAAYRAAATIPNDRDASHPRESRRSPHAAITLIAVSLIAMALVAIGYAWTLRSPLEREGAAPASAPRVAASPSVAPPPAPAPAAAPAATAAAPPAPGPPSAPAANDCPPAVAAMGLCRTYDAAAPRR